jgi:hypothetical protein
MRGGRYDGSLRNYYVPQTHKARLDRAISFYKATRFRRWRDNHLTSGRRH